MSATGAARLAEGVRALSAAVDVLRPLGPWGGVLVLAAGLGALTVGARFRRPLAVWGGALVGAVAAIALERSIEAHLGVGSAVAPWILAALGAAVCGIFPAAFPFAAGALPGALLGSAVPAFGGAALGAALGGGAGGIAGLAATRVVTAGFASLAGGVLVVVGLVAAGGSHPLARELSARPFALAALALVLAISGAAYQVARGPAAPPGPPSLRDLLPEEREQGR